MTDYLTPAERNQLASLGDHDPFARDVLEQLERILGSRMFSRMQQRAQDFLSFIVAKTLLGQAATIKETTIAVAVFGEPATFNTAESAKVRVAGGDLRRRLDAYCQATSDDDPVEIRLPQHTYIPEIIDRRVTVEIARLQNWGTTDDQSHVCAAFVEELRFRLSMTDLRVSLGPTLRLGSNHRVIVVRGGCTVIQERFQANLSAAEFTTGQILCSKIFDEPRNEVFGAARQMADLVRATLSDLGAPGAAAAEAPKPRRAASTNLTRRRFAQESR